MNAGRRAAGRGTRRVCVHEGGGEEEHKHAVGSTGEDGAGGHRYSRNDFPAGSSTPAMVKVEAVYGDEIVPEHHKSRLPDECGG
ncbi:MAG: hypothetical protein MZV70_00660 [Desulfobacterales bacterium]|nr:hypothetical protein [Desulfobacterales bacterium]